MRIVMNMKWTGIKPEQYEQVRDLVKWETNQPKGGVFHVASFDGDGLRVTDIWESAEDLNAFVEKRLMPGVRQVGVQSNPQVEISNLHATFVPALQR